MAGIAAGLVVMVLVVVVVLMFKMSGGGKGGVVIGHPADAEVVVDGNKTSLFVPLFNEKDLTGWQSRTVGKGKWAVQDGVLIGSGDSGCLFTDNRYENFHLRLEARINDGGTSAAWFRSTFDPAAIQLQPARGYAVKISSTHPTQKTGSLFVQDKRQYVSGARVSPAADEWFTLEIIADGPHIIVKVNGQNTANFIDAGPNPRVGQFALRVPDPATIIAFRKIEIKELPAGDRRLQWVHGRGVFEQVKGNVWLERIDDKRVIWRETGRTPEYVRLQLGVPGNSTTLHLHGPNAGITQDGRRWTVPWRDGRWQVLPRRPPGPRGQRPRPSGNGCRYSTARI